MPIPTPRADQPRLPRLTAILAAALLSVSLLSACQPDTDGDGDPDVPAVATEGTEENQPADTSPDGAADQVD